MNDSLTIAKRCFESVALAIVSVAACLASEPSLVSERPTDASVASNRFEYEERPQSRRPEAVLLKYKLSPADAKPGDRVVLSVTMELDDNWHTFSVTQPESSIAPTVITIDELYGLEALGSTFHANAEPEIERPADDLVFEVHRRQVTWTTPLNVLASAKPGRYGVRGTISYQLCNKDRCIAGRPQSFQLGDITGLQPIQKRSTRTPPPRVTPAVPLSRFQARPYGSLFEFFTTAMTLGCTLILTPWVLSVTPVVLGYFAKRCESNDDRSVFPLLSFLGGLIAVAASCSTGAIALSGKIEASDLSHVATHPLLYLALSITYLTTIAHLLGVIQLRDSGTFGDCVGAVLLSFGTSLAMLPVTLGYASILLIVDLKVWSAMGLFALLSGIAVSFFAVALLPYALRALFRRADQLRAIRVVCALWLFGCFANSVQATAALMFPAIPGTTSVATWTIPSRTDLGITCLLDVDHAIQIASHKRQPLLLIFTGINDVNSRLMELKLRKPQNLLRIESYVCGQLYTDGVPLIRDKVERNRVVERNRSLQTELCNDVTTPTMVVMTPDGKTMLASYIGLEQNEGEIAAFLDEAWMKWEASRIGRVPVAN